MIDELSKWFFDGKYSQLQPPWWQFHAFRNQVACTWWAGKKSKSQSSVDLDYFLLVWKYSGSWCKIVTIPEHPPGNHGPNMPKFRMPFWPCISEWISWESLSQLSSMHRLFWPKAIFGDFLGIGLCDGQEGLVQAPTGSGLFWSCFHTWLILAFRTKSLLLAWPKRIQNSIIKLYDIRKHAMVHRKPIVQLTHPLSKFFWINLGCLESRPSTPESCDLRMAGAPGLLSQKNPKQTNGRVQPFFQGNPNYLPPKLPPPSIRG